MKLIVIKVFEQDVDSKYQNTDESKLKLISHQEFYDDTKPRLIHLMFANLARWIIEKL